MTYIPGTGSLKPTTIQEGNNENISQLYVVSTSGVKKNKSDADLDSKSWYETRKVFLIIGISISLIFILITLKYPRFWIFIALGPAASLGAWYAKRIIKKFEPKPKKYSS